jgi:hypothetical protein
MIPIKEASGHILRSAIGRRDKDTQSSQWKETANEIHFRPGQLTPPLPEEPELLGQASSANRKRWPFSKPRKQDPIAFQGQSALFKSLPTELRLLIWEHYLCSRKLHIMRTKWRQGRESRSRIVGIQCHEQPGICPCSHRCWGQLARRPAGGCVGGGRGVRHMTGYEDEEWNFDTRVDFVALLQSCRVM